MSHCWKNVLLEPSATLLEALEVINKEALRIAVVVNEIDELMGIVTDGDIRRGIINGTPLSDKVIEVMNSNPITARKGTSTEQLIDIIESNNILSIPIIDNNKVIDIKAFQDVLGRPKLDNPIFIMAGGFGTRLRPLTDNCPKPMLPVGDTPILEIILNNFIKCGFRNFYISTHYMPEKITDYFGDGSSFGVSIKYIHESEPLGTGGALGLLPEDLPADLPLILMNGDVLTKVDFRRLLEFHENNNAIATVCSREFQYQVPYGVIFSDGNKIKKMVEKPVQSYFVNAGIYVLSSKVFKSVEKNIKIDMPELLERCVNSSENIVMFPMHEYWLDIGLMDDFKRAQSDIFNF